jgi:hypothetical protein
MNIQQKLDQFDEEYSTGCVALPSGSIRVKPERLANTVPVLTKALRIALRDCGTYTRLMVAELLGVEE